ncbi:histidine phosphatase superfamily [Russula earlei]|uniref:Histidine phosphatase superfamily n=1 Tax=Russula earlei TaxID=71964 RepID=A0ACC0TSU9_9AGAM|nr:histidine phosphatase superfamily [Russula earlei]
MSMNQIIAGVLFTAIVISVKAQDTTTSFLGTKTPYSPLQTKYTPAPRGFQPVFINYAGRHGARFLTKPGGDVAVLSLLSQAEKENALTHDGKTAKQMAENFLSIEKDNYENITLLGQYEQTNIGARMLANYAGVFTGRGLNVVMTHKVRTQQSADAFLKGMPCYASAKISRSILSDSMDMALRFYDLSPAYTAYKNSDALQKRVDSVMNKVQLTAIAGKLCSRLFTGDFAQRLLDGKVKTESANGKQKAYTALQLMQDLYDLYTVRYSVRKEMQAKGLTPGSIDFGIWFSQGDLQLLDHINNAPDFLEKGPAFNPLGIQVANAVPLLVDFIKTTDAFIQQPTSADATLRFTHAEAISPFAALLGIPEASTTTHTIADYDKYWQASHIIPLSANIQWILYKNSNQYYIKVLLNEKEVKLPVATQTWPYYQWDAVKAYYLQLLQQLHTSLDTDMRQYLENLK